MHLFIILLEKLFTKRKGNGTACLVAFLKRAELFNFQESVLILHFILEVFVISVEFNSTSSTENHYPKFILIIHLLNLNVIL